MADVSSISCQIIHEGDPPPFREVLASVADDGYQLIEGKDADWNFAILEGQTGGGRHQIVLHAQVGDTHVMLHTTHRALLLAVKQLMMDPYPELVMEYFRL